MPLTPIDKIRVLNKILQEKQNSSIYEGGLEVIVNFASPVELQNLKKQLDDSGILFIAPSSTSIRINLSFESFGIKIFFNKKFFYNTILFDDFKNDFVVFNSTFDYSYYNHNTHTVSPSSDDSTQTIILNTYYYLWIKKIFEENIAGHINENELIIFSNEKGVIKLDLPESVPELIEKLSLKEEVENLQKKISDKNTDYLLILKNQLYETIKTSSGNKFDFLLNNLKTILQNTESDYILFINKFSFENFLSNLAKQKEKFFKDFNEITSKISTQAVSLPISISVAAISVSQIPNEFLKFSVFICFFIYALYYVVFQFSYFRDLKTLEDDFNTSLKKIKKDSGIKPDELNKYEKFFKNKFRFGKIIIISLMLIVVLSFVILAGNTYWMNIKSWISN